MSRYFEASHSEKGNSSSRTRRQQEDQRRMEFRRAIESYTDQCRLQQDISDYPELLALNARVAGQAASRQSAPQVH